VAKRQKAPPGIAGQAGMLRRLQSLQEDLLKAQEEAAAMTVVATAGGGAVTATISGKRRVQAIVIQPEVVDANDVEMLQDLILAAVNQGLEQVERETTEKIGAITGGLGLDLG